MSAKPSKKSAKKTSASGPSAPQPLVSAESLPQSAPAGAAAAHRTAWLDSADPRQRLLGKLLLVGVWIYVAALWLLALDQTFHWGVFGPKVASLP